MIPITKLIFTKPNLLKSWMTARYNVKGEELVMLNMMAKVIERDGSVEVIIDDPTISICPLEPVPHER